MRRRLAALAVAVGSVLGLAGCWSYPHSDESIRVCAQDGWGSNTCGRRLCLDWSAHYGRPFSECPPEIRYGGGMR